MYSFSDAFDHLENLEELILDSNPLSVIDPATVQAFASLRSLQRLSLKDTSLKVMQFEKLSIEQKINPYFSFYRHCRMDSQTCSSIFANYHWPIICSEKFQKNFNTIARSLNLRWTVILLRTSPKNRF